MSPGDLNERRWRRLRSKGQRYRAEAPFGGWKTQTFIAGLRCHGLVAPWIVDRAMNRHIFDVYVETQLAPTLSKGDVVIMDNVAFHKSAKAERLIRDRGAWVLFLPVYSPDLNPIEMAYSKLKSLLRKRAARSLDAVCQATGQICELFTPTECRNYFKAAGYELDETRRDLVIPDETMSPPLSTIRSIEEIDLLEP